MIDPPIIICYADKHQQQISVWKWK